MPTEAELHLADRFAKALDHEDYATAHALLSHDCVYLLRGQRIAGPDAIIASYKGNGDEANQRFDSIRYGSDVRPADDDQVVIDFWDELTHNGLTHRHQCEQRLRIEHDRITRIEHHDLEGETEALAQFKRDTGLQIAERNCSHAPWVNPRISPHPVSDTSRILQIPEENGTPAAPPRIRS